VIEKLLQAKVILEEHLSKSDAIETSRVKTIKTTPEEICKIHREVREAVKQKKEDALRN
jgi:hypothetical protein